MSLHSSVVQSTAPNEASGLFHFVVNHWEQIHETEVVLVYIGYQHAHRVSFYDINNGLKSCSF